jgi:hypothetical protein
MAGQVVLGVSLLSNVDEVIDNLTELEYKHLPFVMVKTLNAVAEEARDEIKREMPNKFILRSAWVQKGIRVEYATKKKMQARVYTLDWLMEYLETGGARSPRSSKHIWVPTPFARKGDVLTGKLKRGMKPKTIKDTMARKVKRRKKAGGKRYAKPKPFMMQKGGKDFVMIRQFADKRLPIVPLYVLVRRVHLYARWGMKQTVIDTISRRFRPEFFKNFEHALSTAKKGSQKSSYISYMAEHGGNGSVASALSHVATGLSPYKSVMG